MRSCSQSSTSTTTMNLHYTKKAPLWSGPRFVLNHSNDKHTSRLHLNLTSFQILLFKESSVLNWVFGDDVISHFCIQQNETVTKCIKVSNEEEEKEVSVIRSRRRVQAHYCDIIGEQFWDEHPDILEDDAYWGIQTQLSRDAVTVTDRLRRLRISPVNCSYHL